MFGAYPIFSNGLNREYLTLCHWLCLQYLRPSKAPSSAEDCFQVKKRRNRRMCLHHRWMLRYWRWCSQVGCCTTHHSHLEPPGHIQEMARRWLSPVKAPIHTSGPKCDMGDFNLGLQTWLVDNLKLWNVLYALCAKTAGVSRPSKRANWHRASMWLSTPRPLITWNNQKLHH